MAAGTVAYVDTRGNKDYLGMVASQIGKRVKQASDMAREERAFASRRAEEQGTSLEEAGIGKGYFFKRALGSRFGGDKIARTRGRFESDPPAGRDPTKNYKQRFRGGFDYKVTNEINSLASNAIVPMSSALSAGLRGVEGGLTQVSQSVNAIAVAIGQLAVAQQDLAKQAMMNGAFMRAFMTYMQRQQSRSSASAEERAIERVGVRDLGSGGSNIQGLLPGAGGTGGGGKGFSGNFFDTSQTFLKSAPEATKVARSARSAISSGLKAAKGTSDAGAIVKSGTTVAKFAPNAGKIAQSAAKMFGMAASPLSRLFGGAVKGFRGSSMHALLDTLKAQSATGALGSGGMFSQLKRFFRGDYYDEYGAAGMKIDDLIRLDQARRARGASLLDSLLMQQGTESAMKANALVRSGDLIDLPIGSADAADFAKGINAADAQALAAARMAAGDRAGVKAAEMATDAIVKKGTQQGLKKGSALAKMMVKQFGAAGTKSILKKIPVVAGVAGILFGIQRAMEGDFLGAGLEITSGLLGATGVGAPVGLAIDGFLLGRDLGMVPMAKGGVLTGKRPVNALMGEAGPEIVAPLNDKTFIKFGEGILEAQKDNKSDYAKLQAEGFKKYYDGMGGWKSFASILVNFFKGLIPDLPELPNLLENDPLSGARRFAAGLVGGYDKLDPTAAGSGLGTYGTGLKTGPSSKIGGSSAYHIDSQFKSSLSMEEKVKMMDDLAAAYAARGRKIEFSNNAVAGQVWNSEASMEEKMALLQKAFEAHQIPRGREVDAGGFNRIDYYIPKIEENRFGASAEGAEILVPTRGATTLDYAQGGDYGAFVNLKDKDGNVIFRTGHGDVRGARSGSVDLSKAKSATPTTGLNLGPQSALPSTDQNFMQKWLASVGLAEQQSASLYQKSAITSMAPSLAAPTIITNNYYGSGSSEATTDTTFSSGFGTSSLSTFALPYSLASK